MKFFNLKALALTAASASVLFAGSAMAQNVVTVPVTATVQNAITMTLVNPLNYGTIVAMNDTAQTATAVVATDDSLTFATTGSPAFTQAVTGTPTAGEITMAGVVGATVNVTLNNVVPPTDGTDSFAIGTILRSLNGAADAATTPGAAFAITATALDTLVIGATITTPAQATQIADGAYAGSFDIVASY